MIPCLACQECPNGDFQRGKKILQAQAKVSCQMAAIKRRRSKLPSFGCFDWRLIRGLIVPVSELTLTRNYFVCLSHIICCHQSHSLEATFCSHLAFLEANTTASLPRQSDKDKPSFFQKVNKTMRPLTEEETKTVFLKLSEYIGKNIERMINRSDERHCFRLIKVRFFSLPWQQALKYSH